EPRLRDALAEPARGGEAEDTAADDRDVVGVVHGASLIESGSTAVKRGTPTTSGGPTVAGKYFDELEIGQTFRHQPGRTVTEADNVWFSCLTMNPQSLHVDFHAAAKAEFGKPLVNSLFTLGLPGGNDRMLAKALTIPADGLILDLEDAVAPDRKAATRGVVREWLRRDFGGRERWVRMNPISTGLGQADLEETIAVRPDGYVVPK